MQTLPSAGFVWLFSQYFIKDLLFVLNLISSEHSHVGSLFTNEERKRQTHDIFDTFATHFIFMMSLIHTAESKMAAITVMFL